MGTKNTKTMYDLAKAKAYELGSRYVKRRDQDGRYFCFALMPAEINALFFSQGFTRESAIKKYCEIWVSCGWATLAAKDVLVFNLGSEDKQMNDILKAEYSFALRNGEILPDDVLVGVAA